MKVVTVIGARPQLIKAAAVSRVLRRCHTEILLHTGQHYDADMSDVFFQELALPPPAVNLGVGSGPQGAQTGAMLAGIERVLIDERPDWVLVYGDTNSTLAGALAASKLGLPLAHVEAGLRSFNRAMPEEINRVVTDHVSTLLLCPGTTAVENLAAEGVLDGVHIVGDVMFDALMHARAQALMSSTVLSRLGLKEGCYVTATVHRAENTNDPVRLCAILSALERIGETVVFPAHPRTRKILAAAGYAPSGRLLVTEPLGYLDMVRLVGAARLVVTDSGGLQKESYWLGVPCVTVRDETEWMETVEAGWNVLAGADAESIVTAVRTLTPPAQRPSLYSGDGAPTRCVELLDRAGDRM
jgi:UDP-N-acetylglucosamine 2-epimerase